jgi:hypothetical protein
MSIRRAETYGGCSQFFFQQPRKKKDMDRVVRLGVVSTSGQECGGWTVFIWRNVDHWMKELFGLE